MMLALGVAATGKCSGIKITPNIISDRLPRQFHHVLHSQEYLRVRLIFQFYLITSPALYRSALIEQGLRALTNCGTGRCPGTPTTSPITTTLFNNLTVIHRQQTSFSQLQPSGSHARPKQYLLNCVLFDDSSIDTYDFLFCLSNTNKISGMHVPFCKACVQKG